NQPIERLLEELTTDCKGALNAASDESRVDRLIPLSGEQPDRDQRVRVNVPSSEPRAAWVPDVDDLPGLHSGQRSRLHIDLVAVDPEVSGPNPTILVLSELDCRTSRH